MSWEEPDPADLVRLETDRDWARFRRRYTNLHPRPFERCLEVARSGGARTAVIETRYLDPDYRSEHSAFFARSFPPTPDSAHRIHFFTARLSANALWDLPDSPGYLGYMVVRPSRLARVGRTCLAIPDEIRDVVHCAVDCAVNFFGQPLTVRAVPFAQQDTQLGRCAHVAAWICHYTASIRGEVSRRPLAEFSLMADASVAEGRPFPSQGLTGLQISNLMREFDLPPVMYRMGELPESGQEPPLPKHEDDDDPGTWDTRAIAVACRYLNSRIPVLVGTHDHAFVLIGYEREQRTDTRPWISFIRHDDQRGPYLRVTNILHDVDPHTNELHTPWALLLAPVPAKLWLMPEAAERSGRSYLMAWSERNGRHLQDLESEGRLTFRTYAIDSNTYKNRAASRRLGGSMAQEIRLARLSRIVWVVEAIDRRRRDRNQSCVMGEALFDSTSSDSDARPLHVRTPGAALIVRTDGVIREPLPSTMRAVRTAADISP